VGCDAVRRQGGPTQWALAHKEKQRSQRAVARFNRLRSVLTQMVMPRGQRKLNRHAAFEAVVSGQLPNLAVVKKDIVQQMLAQQRFVELLRQALKAPSVMGHRAAAMRDQKLKRRKILEQIAGQALHEGRLVGVQVMRAGGVEAGAATGRSRGAHHASLQRERHYGGASGYVGG
jgi:hypothetical protein